MAEFRGDSRERFAVIEGKIDTLAATKAGDIKRLEGDLADEIYARKHTDAALATLQEQMRQWPKIDWADRLEQAFHGLEDKVTEALAELREASQDHESRIESLEVTRQDIADWKRWATRTLLAPVLVALVLAVAIVLAATREVWL